jgi:SAM-dependent methyltransferase
MEEAPIAAGVSEYESYLVAEWAGFVGDPARSQATLDAVAGLDMVRALDIGCGAGQELLPLVRRGALGVGVDPAPGVGRFGLLAQHGRAAFARCLAEQLPFVDGAFDAIICRVALPYMDNRAALSEMARVLRRGGRLLLKIHAAPYYANKFKQGIERRDPFFSIHAARVLAAGCLYHVLGFQVRKVIGTETFMSAGLLSRELARLGLRILRRMPDDNPLTPSFVIEKPGQ